MNARTLTLEAQGNALAAMNKGVARIKRSYAPQTLARHTAASNDATYVPGRAHAAPLDGWARRAASANGFGDAHADAATSYPGRDAYRLVVEGRAARYVSLAEIVGELFDAAAGVARRVYESWARAREARTTYRALRELDTRTLRDVGLDRTEMHSVADEFALPARTAIAFAPGDSPLLYKTAGMRDLAVDLSRWVAGVVRRHLHAWRQRRMARATYRSLRGLDARTLHDIGLDRSELRSVSAEIAGEADRTRMQALRTLRALSLF
jgi:uncharacterized protein YjiS (DUF1127 family)